MHELYFWSQNKGVRVLSDGKYLRILGEFGVRSIRGPGEKNGDIYPGEDVGIAFERIAKPFVPSETDFRLEKYLGRGAHQPGVLEFWPRIFTGHNPENSSAEFFLGARQLEILFDGLIRIFRFIEPAGKNLDVFGHEIRNILILSCTELEAQFRGILKANNYSKKQTATKDYVKLFSFMKLAEFKIDFPLYPSLTARMPFEHWNKDNPTKTLPWYDAYNATKHDREVNFRDASLTHAIDAISACIIIFAAQYGVQKNPLSQVRFVDKADVAIDNNEIELLKFGHPGAVQVNCPLEI
jgi:hypothetical protein